MGGGWYLSMVDNRIKGVERFHRENLLFWRIKCIRKGWKKEEEKKTWTNTRRQRLLRFPYRFLNRSLIDLTGNVGAIKERVKISRVEMRFPLNFRADQTVYRFENYNFVQIVHPFPFPFSLLIIINYNFVYFSFLFSFFFRLFAIFRFFLVFFFFCLSSDWRQKIYI